MKLKSMLLLSSAVVAFGTSYGQSNVTTGTSKYTLLEEGTGTWCGWCPDGYQAIAEKIDSPAFARSIVASWHNADPMALSGDPFNSAYIDGFPGGAIDRDTFTHYNSSKSIWEQKVNVNRGYWATDFTRRDGMTPKFRINMTSYYDPATKKIDITIVAKALSNLTGDFRVNALITEDSVSSAASSYQQHSYLDGYSSSWYYGKGSIIPSSYYSHMAVVRKYTASTIYGDIGLTNPKAGDSVIKTYSYTVPTASNYKQMHVIGMVMQYNTSTFNRFVENSIEAHVKWMANLKTLETPVVTNMDHVAISPNPASTFVNVKASYNTLEPMPTTITVINGVGQVVYREEFPVRGSLFAETVSLKDFANGVYFMNVANNGQSVTKQFVVNR